MLNTIEVLDKGFVHLVTWMPWNMPELVDFMNEQDYVNMHQNDLGPVNAAKASFNKESTKIGKGERGLIAFLAENGHTSPFRHTAVTLEIQAPMMVARQWFKYRIGSAHTDDGFELLGLGNGDDGGPSLDDARNETSRRYVTEEPLFHVPEIWRGAPENKKQGSGGPVDAALARDLNTSLIHYQFEGEELYNEALKAGLCAEQARLFLPAYGMYLHWRWTANVASICHFLNQRLDSHAQVEIQLYAGAVQKLVMQPEVYPLSADALVTLHEQNRGSI